MLALLVFHPKSPAWNSILFQYALSFWDIYFLAWTSSDLYRLEGGFDFRADVCGKPGTTLKDRPYVYFFDPLKTGTIAMCVNSCPNVDVIAF